jgi:hypothetical protein
MTIKRKNNRACQAYIANYPWPGDESIDTSYAHNYGLPWYIAYVPITRNGSEYVEQMEGMVDILAQLRAPSNYWTRRD